MSVSTGERVYVNAESTQYQVEMGIHSRIERNPKPKEGEPSATLWCFGCNKQYSQIESPIVNASIGNNTPELNAERQTIDYLPKFFPEDFPTRYRFHRSFWSIVKLCKAL